jgi:membrane protease YdiL (CAAX protease family)
VVIALTDGRRGYRRLGSRLLRWRVGWVWYVVALGLPVALVLVTALVNQWFGAPPPDLAAIGWTDVALVLAWRVVDVSDGAAGEEPGWRGYALPALQSRYSPLASAGLLGVVAAVWHLPLVVLGHLAPVGLPSTVVITFIYVWLFDHTRGSLLMALLFHASQGAFTFGMLGWTGADADRAPVVYFGVLVVVVGVLLVSDRGTWRTAPPSAVDPADAVGSGRVRSGG